MQLQYVDARNQQAHETSEDFARLLLNLQVEQTNIFDQWKDIFPLLYGGSVEELAARRAEKESRLLLGNW